MTAGNLYTVKAARKVGALGPFRGISLFRGRKLIVELELAEEVLGLPLQEFKSRLLEWLESDAFSWDSDGRLEERKEIIGKSQTHGEVIRTLADDFYEVHG